MQFLCGSVCNPYIKEASRKPRLLIDLAEYPADLFFLIFIDVFWEVCRVDFEMVAMHLVLLSTDSFPLSLTSLLSESEVGCFSLLLFFLTHPHK